MSLAETIKKAFNVVEPALEHEAAKLLEIIFSGPDPKASIAKARQVLVTDAANAAADAVLDQLLPADSPPAGSEPLPSSASPKT